MQTLPMAFESHVWEGQYRGTSVGIVGRNPSLSTTSGLVQTSTPLAQRIAPPQAKRYGCLFGLLIGLSVPSWGLLATGDHFPNAILGVIWLAIISVPVYYFWKQVHRYNNEIFPHERAAWEQSAICYQCGDTFSLVDQ